MVGIKMDKGTGEMGTDSLVLDEIEQTKNSLSTDRLDMSFGEIMSMYEKEEIIIDPEFQRLFRWSKEQQTRFIESLVLGIPIPPIFVAETRDGKWELVDGLQRISTVLSLFGVLGTIPEKNRLTLSEGELVPSLENYNIDTLPLKIQLNIKRAICRIEIVKWNSKMDMRYELFNRLNTGGSILTNQEIRNCVFRGVSNKFNRFLERMAAKDDFIVLIRPTDRQREQKYLEELVLRFTSLVNNNWEKSDNWKNTADKLSTYMTHFMKNVTEDESFDFDSLENLFERTLTILSPLGRDIFRAANGNFSSSYYDGITIGIASNIDYYEKADQTEIIGKIKKLIDNEKFQKNVGTASGNKNRVINRIKVSLEIFKVE